MGGIEDWDIKIGETPPDLEGFLHLDKYPNPTRKIVDELEEDNIRKATVKYLASKPSLKKAPFDYQWFFQLHKEMLGDVYDWAGTQRKTNTSVGVDKHDIPQLISQIARLMWLHGIKISNGNSLSFSIEGVMILPYFLT